MTTTEFELNKAQLAKLILNTDSAELLEAMTKTYRRISKQQESKILEDAPCQYSVKEVKARLQQTSEDAIAGKGLTTAEVIKATDKFFLKIVR